MAVTDRDWNFLRDAMVSIDNKMIGGSVRVFGPPGWMPPIPAERTAEAARDYLQAVAERLAQVEKAVDDAMRSPMERAVDAGREVGSLVVVAAQRATKIAKEVAHDLADTFEKTVDRMQAGGMEIAKGLGVGAAFALIVGLLLLREWKS